MYNSLALAKRYSRALFEVSSSEGLLKEVKRDLSIVFELLKDSGVRSYIKRSAQLDDYFQHFLDLINVEQYEFCKLTKNLFKVLFENQRLQLIDLLVEDFFYRVHKLENKEKVIIETAYKLDDTGRNKFIDKIKGELGDNFFFEFMENEDYIGGYRISFKSKVVDATLRNRIELLTRGIRV